jgi:hypothetical protein
VRGAKREAAHDGGDVSSTAPHAGRVRAHAHVQKAAQKRAAVADRTVAADDMLLDDHTVMSSGPFTAGGGGGALAFTAAGDGEGSDGRRYSRSSRPRPNGCGPSGKTRRSRDN